MRWMVTTAALVALALAGCSSGSGDGTPPGTEDSDGDGYGDAVEDQFGSDPGNATSQPEATRSTDVDFSDTVQVVGTGIPSVQCPADAVNSQLLTWTVAADTGDAREAWVSDLVFTVEGAATVNDVDLFVYDPSGAEKGAATSAANTEAIEVAGRQDLGDWTIEVRGCSGAGDVSVTAVGLVFWIPSDEELLASEA